MNIAHDHMDIRNLNSKADL